MFIIYDACKHKCNLSECNLSDQDNNAAGGDLGCSQKNTDNDGVSERRNARLHSHRPQENL